MTTLDNDSVTSFILGVVRDTLNMPLPGDTSATTRLGPGGLELESLTMVELTVVVEREYGISLPDEVIDELSTGTIGTLVETIVGLGAPAEPLSRDDIKRLLVASKILIADDPARIADDAEVVLDSLSLVWFQHQLKEVHGIDLELDDDEVGELTSVAAIHGFLVRRLRSADLAEAATR